MARCPFAVWKPIWTKTASARPITPTAAVVHSDAGYVTSLQGWWLNPGSGGLSCHFHVGWDGSIEQYVDTDRAGIANVEANDYGISIECSNSPSWQQVTFARDAYSPAQVAAITRLLGWICDTHLTVPRRVCTDGRHGLGWHDQYPQWTTRGHVCPGAARVEALRTRIFPAVIDTRVSATETTQAAAPTIIQEDDDMTAYTLTIQPGQGASIPIPPPNGGDAGWGRVWISFLLASGNAAATVQIWAVVANGAGFTSLPGLSTTPTVRSVKRIGAEMTTGTEGVQVTIPATSPGPVTVMVEARKA